MSQILNILFAVLIAVWFGVPWGACLIRNGETRRSHLLLHCFMAGLPTLGLAAQFCWRFGWNAHEAAWLVCGLVCLVNVACLLALRGEKISWTSSENAGLCSAGLILILFLSVFAINSGRPYYGRMWGDQINYSLTANYIQNAFPKPFVPPYTHPAERVVYDSGMLDDRIGQSSLHAWLAEFTGSRVLESFVYVSALAVVAYLIAIYLIARVCGISDRLAAVAAATAAIAPPIHAIHLESFLSQIAATPYILFGALATHYLIDSKRLIWLWPTALCTAWVLTAYFEFFPLLLLVAGVTWLAAVWRSKTIWQQTALLLSGLLAGILFASNISSNPLLRMLRATAARPDFEKFFPWAYKPEGFARLIIGDWAPTISHELMIATASLAFAITVWAITGLFRHAFREKQGLPLAMVSLLLFPLLIAIVPGEHSYQFYKTLQSFWPITLLGFVVWWHLRHRGARVVAVIYCPLFLIMAGSSFWMLATEATGQSPRSGLSPYMRQHGDDALTELFRNQKAQQIILSSPLRHHWNDMLINGVVALQLSPRFEHIQSKWIRIGEHAHAQPISSLVPDDPTTAEVRTIQPDFFAQLDSTILVQVGAPYLEPAGCLMDKVAAIGQLQLFQPHSNRWLVASTLAALDQDATIDERGIYVGNGPERFIRLDLESSQDIHAGVGLEITFEPADESPEERWHIYSNTGYGTYVVASHGCLRANSGPLRRGVTELFIGPAPVPESPDQPPPRVELRITRIIYGL